MSKLKEKYKDGKNFSEPANKIFQQFSITFSENKVILEAIQNTRLEFAKKLLEYK